MNWLGSLAIAGAAIRVGVKLRSSQPPVAATLLAGDDGELVLDAPSGAVAPGQAAVLYDGDRVLGGGWIRRSSFPQPEGSRPVALDRLPSGRA